MSDLVGLAEKEILRKLLRTHKKRLIELEKLKVEIKQESQ